MTVNNNLDLLKKFSKKSSIASKRNTDVCVIYTRVSSKEQAENNTSLDSQRRYCEEFANKRNFQINAYFGGTYESAKQDERKEFQNMLAYVRKNKSIEYIIVYSYDRFSRTGANAAYLSEELQKVGIKVLAVTQEVDTESATGKFQQNLLYMFSQFDNDIRRDKTIKGMIENLLQGYWVGATPFGYRNLKRKEKARDHIYEITEQGRLLKKGFQLKAEGKLNNLEIVEYLQKLGSTVNYKSFTRILSNPFYCGYISHSLIPNELPKGKHPPLISEELFLKRIISCLEIALMVFLNPSK